MSGCASCGTPFTDLGDVDREALDDTADQSVWTRALREDRATLVPRLEHARTELAAAKRYKDADATSAALRRVEQREHRLAEIDRLLAAAPAFRPVADGTCCDACGTRFTGGRPDVDWLDGVTAEHDRSGSRLAALERELVAIDVRVRHDERSAALSADRGDKRDTDHYRERAEKAASRRPAVEAAIEHARAELHDRRPPALRSERRAAKA